MKVLPATNRYLTNVLALENQVALECVGQRSHLAKIRWRIDQTLAEMMLPDTIDDHACAVSG